MLYNSHHMHASCGSRLDQSQCLLGGSEASERMHVWCGAEPAAQLLESGTPHQCAGQLSIIEEPAGERPSPRH